MRRSVLRSLHVAPGEEGDRVRTLELFFDLVYAFAFTQVTALMAHGRPPGSLVDGLIVLSLLWWSWCSFSWLANQAHADEGIVQGAFLLATISIFVASIAIPDAFRTVSAGFSAAAVLVACYAVVRLAHLGVYLVAAGRDVTLRRQILVTLIAVLLPTLALLSLGAALGGTAQRWIWLVAVGYDFAAVFITAKTTQGWRIQSAAHFAERYGLIVLLALGESIVAIAAGLGHTHLTWRVLVGAALSIMVAIGLYFAYFLELLERLEKTLASETGRDRARLAEDAFTYFHFPIIVGIIFTALGIDLAMVRLHQPQLGVTGSWCLAGGAAVFLAGTVCASIRARQGTSVARLVATVILIALAPLLAFADSLVAVGSIAIVTLALALAEAHLGSGHEQHDE